MADLIQQIMLERGQFIATSDFGDGTLGGWYVPLSSPIDLRYHKAGNGRKLDIGCLPTSSTNARLCLKHRAHWSDAHGCPACHKRPVLAPVSKPEPEAAEEAQISFLDMA